MMKSAPDKYKVLVLGLDGATFDLMLPWIEQGHLPALGKLVADGARSRLRSTIPPHTPCAWSSFMTGMNPGKHGLFDFSEPVANSYDFRFVNAASRHGETLWGNLSRHGRGVGVINVPMTFPPEPVHGFLISGLDSPHEKSRFTYPHSVQQELKDETINYQIDLQHMGNVNTNRRRDACLRELHKMETNRTRAYHFLSQKYPSDFEMLVYTATDRVQHHFWHYMDPNHDLHDERIADRYRNAIRDVYVHLDGLIAGILRRQDENTIVMLMSDHGFGPTSSVRVRLNQTLAHSGLLSFSRSRAGRVKQAIGALLDRLLRSTLSDGAKRRLAATLPGLRSWFENLDEARLDWRQTAAYVNEVYRTCPAIWLNRRGRLPDGIVEEDEADAVLSSIEKTLKGLRDPATGKPVISNLYRASEMYHGPYTCRAPDLIPSWWEDGFLLEQSSPGGTAEETVQHAREIRGGVDFVGSHRLEGIFTITGGPARSGLEFCGAHITDIAPTVLYLMGLPIPEEMDGEPLLDALDPAYVSNNPPCYEAGSCRSESDEDSSRKEAVFSDEESELVEQRLKLLGYL